MFQSTITIRVRYAETDRMGYAYYGNYAAWFEVARVEALRDLGLNYKELEDGGILLPVLDFSTRYHKPAYYDDALTIKTTIREMPGARITFYYEVWNATGELINNAETTLVFISTSNNRPCRPPAAFLERMSGYFSADVG